MTDHRIRVVPLLFVLATAIEPARTQTRWQLIQEPLPSAREGAAMAYDAARGVSVLFGGYLPTDDTWESHDGTTWTQRSPSNRPAARAYAAMAYDSHRARTVLFGGIGTSGVHYTDTWEWDGNDWLQLSNTISGVAQFAHLAYDEARHRMVLVASSRTWEWDGSQWVNRPNGFYRHSTFTALAYDGNRQQVVGFGGFDGFGGTSSDTMAWDGSQWTALQVGFVRPGARGNHTLTYDLLRGRLVLFGGSTSPGGLARYEDTWVFDGTSWSLLAPATHPPALNRAATAYDASNHVTLLFGGAHSAAFVREAWSFDGVTWTRSSPERPGRRSGFSLAHDPHRDRTVLFGGNPASTTLVDDTWEWTGDRWIERHPANAPTPRFGAALTYAGMRSEILLFGGATLAGGLHDTWLFDGTQWSPVPTTAQPPDRMEPALTDDSARHKVVLFGGHTYPTPLAYGDTWEFDGTTWTERTPRAGPSPSARSQTAMAYDVARGRTVLFGGFDSAVPGYVADTWTWDGSTWTSRTPGHHPPARSQHRMCWDESRQRIVLFGGQDNVGIFSDTWEWDGNDWVERLTTGPYLIGNGVQLVYRNASREVFAHDGNANEEWSYGPSHPATFATFAPGCTGSRGVPSLVNRAGDLPWIDEPLELEYANLPADRLALLLAGISSQSWLGAPLPLDLTFVGMTGCSLHVSAEFQIPVLTFQGRGETVVFLPNDPHLAGDTIYFQLFVSDVAANPFMATFSNAVRAVIGVK